MGEKISKHDRPRVRIHFNKQCQNIFGFNEYIENWLRLEKEIRNIWSSYSCLKSEEKEEDTRRNSLEGCDGVGKLQKTAISDTNRERLDVIMILRSLTVQLTWREKEEGDGVGRGGMPVGSQREETFSLVTTALARNSYPPSSRNV